MLDSVTLVGNLTKDPELRFTPSGAAVVSLRLASTPRRFDRATASYVDGPATFVTVSAWRGLAENVAESLKKGDRAVVTGRLRQRTWEHKDGGTRSDVEIDADAVGADLTYRVARLSKVVRDRPGRERYDEAAGPGEPPVTPLEATWQRPAADARLADDELREPPDSDFGGDHGQDTGPGESALLRGSSARDDAALLASVTA